jgi:hypothetical protein
LNGRSRARDAWNWIVAPLVRTATNATGCGLIFIPKGGIAMLIAALVGGGLGAAHGWRMAYAHTYDWTTGGGVVEFIADNTWGLPNAVVGSLFATPNLWNEVRVETSRGSGNLYHAKGWFGNYDTTLGNVTVGTIVPKHEAVHALQARLFGPAFYPIFIASYVICTVAPYWLLYHDYKARPIKGIGAYFKCGVYPNTWFEVWAYSVEGSPPCG